MKSREAIKTIMEHKNVTNADLAKRLGVSQANVWGRINTNKSMMISKMNELMNQLDYEVVLLPRGKAGRIEGAIVVDDTEG